METEAGTAWKPSNRPAVRTKLGRDWPVIVADADDELALAVGHRHLMDAHVADPGHLAELFRADGRWELRLPRGTPVAPLLAIGRRVAIAVAIVLVNWGVVAAGALGGPTL